MKNVKWVGQIGILMSFCLAGCAWDARSEALIRLRQLKAEDYFTNVIDIEMAHAVEWGDTGKINSLLVNGAVINTIGSTDDMTFLIWSVIKNNKTSYQYLLENGADPNIQSKHGDKKISVMNLIVMERDSFWMKLALRYGGNPNAPQDNQSIVFEAIRQHAIENINMLISAGVDMNYQNRISGNTPLVEALYRDMYDIIYLLLENGANPLIKNRNGHDFQYLFNHTIVDPVISASGDQLLWREKVINLLQLKGITVGDVTNN
jgi:ankyrin repeat protein